jgi:hypothetical protein
MPAKEYKIIKIMCYRLPYELSNQVYNEFESRFKEATWLIKNSRYYRNLRNDIKTVELLLALSVFYKRVISNLDAVVKFYGTVNRVSNAEAISIGSYDLDGKEKNKLLAIVMHYKKIQLRFGMPDWVFEYNETKQFLSYIIQYRASFGKKNNG